MQEIFSCYHGYLSLDEIKETVDWFESNLDRFVRENGLLVHNIPDNTLDDVVSVILPHAVMCALPPAEELGRHFYLVQEESFYVPRLRISPTGIFFIRLTEAETIIPALVRRWCRRVFTLVSE